MDATSAVARPTYLRFERSASGRSSLARSLGVAQSFGNAPRAGVAGRIVDKGDRLEDYEGLTPARRPALRLNITRVPKRLTGTRGRLGCVACFM